MSLHLLKTALRVRGPSAILARKSHMLTQLQSSIPGHGSNAQLQTLHYKVYDKDAGFKEQREANSVKNADAFEVIETQRSARSQQKIPELERLDDEHVSIKERENTRDFSDDPDVFGGTVQHEELEEDAGDVAEEEFISNPVSRSKQLSIQQYAFIIKEHLNAKRLKDAIDVLEQRMLKEDRVKPDAYIYKLLISGCAKAGYTRKAFNLFTRMRQRGIIATGGIYTSLFNACSESPYPAEGLERANRLREIMLEKGYEPNLVNYNAMIKAYGRCGDITTAFMLADEMRERRVKMGASTFNFLLQACASDTEYGFRHCLLTWHKMMQSGVKPDYYTFFTVLRCVRDCGFGDLITMDQVLKQILEERKALSIEQPQKQTVVLENPAAEEQSQQSELAAPTDDVATETEKTQLITQPSGSQLQPSHNKNSVQLTSDVASLEMPNLLAPQPHLGSLISISEITQPHDRFLLLGGLTGFLDLMKQYNITPNIQCFTAMLEVIPPTRAAEKQLISFIRKIGLKTDIDFFNVLIKKRSMRFDYEGAKEVLSMIRTAKLNPDIVTYGVLALGCQTAEEARELIERMRDNGVRLNIQILGAMLRQGCEQRAFPYITEILQISLDENIKPSDVFLKHLHKFYNSCARAIDSRHPMTKSGSYKRGHGKFCDKLRLWYEEHGLSGLKLEDKIKKVQQNPYQHYREENVEGLEPLKNENLAKKQKVRKYIKKIKTDNLMCDDEKLLKNRNKRIE